jgi:acyl dehydratase
VTPVFADVRVGDVIATRDVSFTRDSLVRYAGASGDFNPIHYNDAVAAEANLPGVLAHGMLTMGVAVQPVVDWVGDPACIIDYNTRFTRPVVVDVTGGATLSVIATVGQVAAESKTVRVDLRVTCGGETVLAKAHVWVSLVG